MDTKQMQKEISVRVKLFSHLRHVLGRGELELKLLPETTGMDVVGKVRGRLGDPYNRLPVRIAVNGRFVRGNEPLNNGDEVALIPPVQGG